MILQVSFHKAGCFWGWPAINWEPSKADQIANGRFYEITKSEVKQIDAELLNMDRFLPKRTKLSLDPKLLLFPL